MGDPLGRPATINDLKRKDIDPTKRLESMLYLIRVSEDDFADLSECELTALPSEFYNLCRIFRKEIVNISRNRLSSLKINKSENDLMKLDGILKELDASHNLLKEFPVGLLSVRTLVSLNLSENQIARIPDSIGDLYNLRELNLKANFIVVIPESIARLAVLRMLDVSSNVVRRLPPCLAEMEALEVLMLDEEDMETPPKDICVHGIGAIKDFLRGVSGPSTSIAEKTQVENGVKPLTGSEEKIRADEDAIDATAEKVKLLGFDQDESEKKSQRLEKLMQEQKELDDLVQNAVSKRSVDLKSVFDEINELEKHTSSLIENSLRCLCRTANEEKDVDLQKMEEILSKRREELDKEQHEWLKNVDEESSALARLVYFEADQRRKRSMDEIAKRVHEMDLLSNLKSAEGQSKFAQICKEITTDQALLEDFVLSVKERADENSRNLMLEGETIAKALADISQLEIKKRDEQASAVLAKLKEERTRLLMLFEQLSAEKDFRRKQLYMDMQSEMHEEEQSLKRIVADYLRRYAELVGPVQRNETPPRHKNKLMKRLSPFSALFGWKKKPEKAAKKTVCDKEKEAANDSPVSVESHSLPPNGEANGSKMIVAKFEEECTVCLDDTVKVLFFPCGHVCACERCASTIKNCPLCRAEIVRKILLSTSW